MFTVWLALLLVGVPAGAEELARGEGEDNASPLTWLVETLTLEETQRQVASWFGHPPSVQHAGSITILNFSDSPGLSPHAEGSHSDRADHDACNAQPQWSFQFRAGRLVSVVWNPPDGTAIELPKGLSRAHHTSVRTVAGATLAAWRLDRGRILLALGGRCRG